MGQRPQARTGAAGEDESLHTAFLAHSVAYPSRWGENGLVEYLSGQDARFIYAETPALHMHTLKVAVVDPARTPGGYTFERFRAELAARLHLLEPFRRRLVLAPFGLAHGFWFDDPEFDLGRHLLRRTAPAPGGRRELDAIASEIASEALPRDRPLWQITVVEGLAGGRIGFVAKIHHAVADGKAAAELLANIMETEPSADAEPPATPSWWARPIPGRGALIVLALRSWVMLALRLPNLLTRSYHGLRRKTRFRRDADVLPPKPILDAPRTPFNRSLTPRRQFVTVDLPIAEMKEVKASFGVTLNDVFVAVCGGALRALLEEDGTLPSRPLIAGIPIGAALDDSTRLWGNAVDNMYTSLATDLADPVERLHRVAAVNAASKASRAAMGSDVVVEWQWYVPAPLLATFVRAFARSGLADRMPPAINCILSNVAGPPEPLYLAGARLEQLYSVGPILEGIGLNITVWSYLDRMDVSLLACPDVGPDLDRLACHIEGAHRALVDRARAQAGAASPQDVASDRTR
jgi:diacylglycerol O-acyltransferase